MVLIPSCLETIIIEFKTWYKDVKEAAKKMSLRCSKNIMSVLMRRALDFGLKSYWSALEVFALV